MMTVLNYSRHQFLWPLFAQKITLRELMRERWLLLYTLNVQYGLLPFVQYAGDWGNHGIQRRGPDKSIIFEHRVNSNQNTMCNGYYGTFISSTSRQTMVISWKSSPLLLELQPRQLQPIQSGAKDSHDQFCRFAVSQHFHYYRAYLGPRSQMVSIWENAKPYQVLLLQ